MSGGSITGNTQNGNPADVYIENTSLSAFQVSGDAAVGALKLFAYGSGNTRLTVGSGWTGNVTTLHLRGNDETMATVISYWENKQILRPASGYTLTAGDVAKITSIGNFMSTAASDNTQAISPTHRISDSGGTIGYLTTP